MYAYREKRYTDRASILRFYCLRFGAIVASYYLFYVLNALYYSVTRWERHDEFLAGGAITSLFLVQAFAPGSDWFPNGPGWTLSCMSFSWWLFPLTHSLLRHTRSAADGITLRMLGALAASLCLMHGPIVSMAMIDLGKQTGCLIVGDVDKCNAGDDQRWWNWYILYRFPLALRYVLSTFPTWREAHASVLQIGARSRFLLWHGGG